MAEDETAFWTDSGQSLLSSIGQRAVQRLTKIKSKASAQVMRAFEEGQITQNQAEALARYAPGEQRERLDAILSDSTPREVRRLIECLAFAERVLRAKPRLSKDQRAQVTKLIDALSRLV
jgi:hypothetical protein